MKGIRSFFWLIIILSCLFRVAGVNADCIPTYAGRELSPIWDPTNLSMTKLVRYDVTWPDGHVDNNFAVDDVGKYYDTLQNSCCGSVYRRECWPYYDPPQVSNG